MEDISKDVAALERQLYEVHKGFEQYFLGNERQWPEAEREALRKKINSLRDRARLISTANKFRLNTLHQRFISYDQMWTRTLKQIEEGTYHRDVMKAKRKAAKAQAEAAAAPPKVEQATPAAEAAPAKREAPKPRPAAGSPVGDDHLKRVFDTYVLARRRTGESTRVSLDSLSKQLQERAANIVAKHGCNSVEFKVVIKDGKALIKAQPKKD
ncbi:MAG: hypothetical protein JXR83_11205 [Deltaproteobacteria bacterium]|nr:hypothetical protein [Deltaproteobacteria bacterium]